MKYYHSSSYIQLSIAMLECFCEHIGGGGGGGRGRGGGGGGGTVYIYLTYTHQ